MKHKTRKVKKDLVKWVLGFTLVLTLINSYVMINMNSDVQLIKYGSFGTPDVISNNNDNIEFSGSVKGSDSAPITIIEYSDFECSYCTRFYTQTYGQLMDTYVKTGKVKFEYRHFPLSSIHANAQKAAEATECAGKQDNFWGMHDLLFEDGASGGVSSFKNYAKTLGLDSAKFDACLDSGETAAKVRNDMAEGQKAGVTGTPAFMINGELLVGAQPFSAFKNIIEATLI